MATPPAKIKAPPSALLRPPAGFSGCCVAPRQMSYVALMLEDGIALCKPPEPLAAHPPPVLCMLRFSAAPDAIACSSDGVLLCVATRGESSPPSAQQDKQLPASPAEGDRVLHGNGERGSSVRVKGALVTQQTLTLSFYVVTFGDSHSLATHRAAPSAPSSTNAATSLTIHARLRGRMRIPFRPKGLDVLRLDASDASTRGVAALAGASGLTLMSTSNDDRAPASASHHLG